MRKRGSSIVRRKLDFKEKPFFQKIFYLDVRSESLKNKAAKRIQELGGNVEGFLTKEVNLLITDKNRNDIKPGKKSIEAQDDLSPSSCSQTSVNVPLSRGKALLLKATQQKNVQQQNVTRSGGNDIIHNASLLGVKVESVNIFLKESRKLLQEFKQLNGDDGIRSEEIDGISPLRWKESNKENRNSNIIKIEDSTLQYKPMIKHLDEFPCIRYSDQLVSPFDKSVTLCKESKNKPHRYSTKTTQKVLVHKGGFCEACDYWFKCSLREHLNSEKHKKFVHNDANFEKLDNIISKMPSLNDFITKYKARHTSCTLKTEDLSQNSNIISDSNSSKENCLIENTKCDLYNENCVVPNRMDIVTDDKIENDRVSYHEGITMITRMDIDEVVISKSSLNEDSMDSGTGPELANGNSMDSISCLEMEATTSRDTKINIKRTNSDSALPPDVADINDQDVVMESCSKNLNSQESSCDNAMFVCIQGIQGDNVPIEQATTYVRKRLSSISIQGSVGSERENTNFDANKLPKDFHNLIQKHNDNSDCDMPVLDKVNCVEYDFTSNATRIPNILDNKVIQKRASEIKFLDNSGKMSTSVFQENRMMHDRKDLEIPVLGKFGCFSPQNTDSSVENADFVDIASHWMKDICGQDSVKRQERNDLPSTLQFSKESNFILASENTNSSLKSLENLTNKICSDNVSNDTSSVISDKHDNRDTTKIMCSFKTANYSDISVTDTSEDIFQNIQNPFSSKNLDLHSESSNQFLCATDCSVEDVKSDISMPRQMITQNALTPTTPSIFRHGESSNHDLSTSTNSCSIADLKSEVSTPRQIINQNALTPNTPSSFFRPWLTECDTPGYDTGSERKAIKMKFNLSAAAMGSLLKEVKSSTCKKKKIRVKRKLSQQSMMDNRNNKTVYSCQQNGTKLKLCKVPLTPLPQQNDLHTYWKVRKSNGCKLVFSANKRKMEETTDIQNRLCNGEDDNSKPAQKRRRCLAF